MKAYTREPSQGLSHVSNEVLFGSHEAEKLRVTAETRTHMGPRDCTKILSVQVPGVRVQPANKDFST